ncbi:MAG TPA: hypothetical protein VFU63_13405 [Ktedonobacterales bacterium]|nr:hypothetical protein [Ktedonobacterales bacterium]
MTRSSDKRGRKTVELPALTPEDTPAVAGAADADAFTASADADEHHVTRELEASSPADSSPADSSPADIETLDAGAATAATEEETGPSAEMSGPVITAYTADDSDLEATVQRAAVTPPLPPSERPRHNTLASITRPRGSSNPHNPPLPEPPAPTDLAPVGNGIPDETEGDESGEGEWAIADQPTVSLSPGTVLGAHPQFLTTGGPASWPPRNDPELPLPGSLPEAAASLRRRAIPRRDRTGQRRYASPGGRPMPGTPPGGIPRTAFPDPRMERLQELQRRRDMADQGEYDPEADRPVTDRVRQWWSDLRPGLRQALKYQHEARASGALPIPAYEQAPSSRLGDVFGRLAASARGLTGRAHSAAAPALKRLHNQAEHAAQAIVGRIEGDIVRQQAPFLGPGRIAVFFRPGVSVGQAQRLLSSNDARPLRIIPRKHGFLAYVLPGTEEQVGNRLRVHPYIRDVVFIPMDAYNDTPEEYDE